ncbi:hypothetical protein BV898_14744 [Hypsibius exemplaris]|uniref:Uncharacterized protein n=1 Tax=Hypsibius exemplaris TaxID=2072580 RepID=A0A9X6NAV9_HYPEX|nr:hypothetical protein BV898_14744 [Hypsibius exemplaris]
MYNNYGLNECTETIKIFPAAPQSFCLGSFFSGLLFLPFPSSLHSETGFRTARMSKYPPVYPAASAYPPSYGAATGNSSTPARPFLKNSLEILTSEMPPQLENMAVQVADAAIESIRDRHGDLSNSDLAKKISEDFGATVGYGEWNCMVWSAKIAGSDLNYWFRFGDNSSVMFELGPFIVALYTQFHTTVQPQDDNMEVVKTFMSQQTQNQTIAVVRDAVQRGKRDENFRPVAHIKDRMGDLFGDAKRWQCIRSPSHPAFDFELDTDGDDFIELRVEDMTYLIFKSERSD